MAHQKLRFLQIVPAKVLLLTSSAAFKCDSDEIAFDFRASFSFTLLFACFNRWRRLRLTCVTQMSRDLKMVNFITPFNLDHELELKAKAFVRHEKLIIKARNTFVMIGALLWRNCWMKYAKPVGSSVTSKKSPNVYKRCPKMISLEKLKILTTLQKLHKNVGYLGKLIVAKGF